MDNVDQLVERVAQFLHDEGGFDEAWQATWPEHPSDTGQREGGFVRVVPSDVQAKFRDVAKRLCTMLPTRAQAATITSLQAQLDQAREALKPFAAFSVPGAPDDFAITGGSPFAQKQLTAGDCRNARAALGEQS